ncbi:uncharacterized protein LOC141568564 isoform X3 [Rhinolophus sinicus]|uniref:uncharacterized protein LOC141568564 isoform X3 n=1 Tax=Rhinolophus sinicus TaxID=89399 RepID=UPI003D7AEA77
MPVPSPPFNAILELSFWNGHQSCHHITLDVLNVIQMSSFQYFLYLRVKKEVIGVQISITLSRSIGAAADGKNPFPSMAKQYSIVYTSSVWEKAAPLALILKPDHSVPLPVPGTFTPAAATLEHRASESIRKEERLQRQWLLLLCSDNLRTGRTDCAAEGATEHPSTEVRTPSKLANFCCAPFAQPHIFQLCLLSLWSRCLGSTSTTEAQVSFPRRCQWRHRPAEGSIEILMTCAQGVCVGKRNRRARTCSRH